jgi:hypothetical protein
MKKLLIFALFMLPLLANAEEVMVDGIKYIVDMDTKTAEVIGSYNNEDKLVYIPSTVTVETVRMMTYRVTSIAEGAFRNHQMEELYLPESLETIGDQAFAHCTNMKSIILGEGVKTIGSGAFHDTGLEHIYVCTSQIPETYPDNSSIPDNTDWAKMTLHVPASLVEEYRKSDLPNWRNVNDRDYIALPEGVNKGEAVVDGIKYKLNEEAMTAEAAGLADSTITDLVIPASITVEGKEYQVQSIGNNAFNNNHFSSISLSEGLKTIGRASFMYSWKIEKLIIHKSVETIEPCAFENSSMKQLVIGEGIKTIGSCAIRNLPWLSEFYIYAPQMPEFPYDDLIDMIDESSWYRVNLFVPNDLVEEFRQCESSYINQIRDENILPISKDYESFLTSIRTMKSESYKSARFSLDGRRLTSPQKGINIIHQSDGTVRKEIVR